MSEDSTSPEFVGGPHGVYVDRVTVVYHSVDHPSFATPRATVVMIVDAGMQIDRERLRVEIERLHSTPTDLGRPSHESFVSEERLHHVNWGASGATLELIMWVSSAAVSGIVDNVAYDGLKAVRDRIGVARGPAWRTEPVNGQLAQRRAIERAEAAWSELRGTDFTVLSCNLADDTAAVVLRATDGSIITAQPSITGSSAIGPITRAYPEE